MSKKSKYSIKKVRRVMKMKSNDFNPATYNVWKVSGPKGFSKYYTTKKDATAFVKRYTDTSVTTDIIIDLIKGR
jgi:hypothetical protein